jgi:hypothetical protein
VTKNIEINNLSNIATIYKLGASDKKEKSILTIDTYNTGGSRIFPKPA